MRLFRKRPAPRVSQKEVVHRAAEALYDRVPPVDPVVYLSASDFVDGVWLMRDRVQQNRDRAAKARAG